jgi:hypothetical protein
MFNFPTTFMGSAPDGVVIEGLHIDYNKIDNWVGMNEIYVNPDGTEQFSGAGLTDVAGGASNDFTTITDGQFTTTSSSGSTNDRLDNGFTAAG